MKRLTRRLPVLVLMGSLLIVAGLFLGIPFTSGSDDLPACSELEQVEVVVTLDEPQKEEVRLCRGPGGDVWKEITSGKIVEEDENSPPSMKPDPEEVR